jgi:hypothetical protein
MAARNLAQRRATWRDVAQPNRQMCGPNPIARVRSARQRDITLHSGRKQWGKEEEEWRGEMRGGEARGRNLACPEPVEGGAGWCLPLASPPRIRISKREAPKCARITSSLERATGRKKTSRDVADCRPGAKTKCAETNPFSGNRSQFPAPSRLAEAACAEPGKMCRYCRASYMPAHQSAKPTASPPQRRCRFGLRRAQSSRGNGLRRATTTTPPPPL